MADYTIRAVIWDMGGVLLRTCDRLPRAHLAESLGMSYEELDNFVFASETSKLAELGRVSEQDRWEEIARHFKLTPEELSRFRQAFWGGDRFDEELIHIIDQLRPAYCTGLLSNAWSEARKYVSQRSRLLDAFDISLFSAEVGMAKPDPRFYRLILERLEVEPSQAVFVDDALSNVEGARRVGMTAVRFHSPAQTLDELRKMIDIPGMQA